MTPDQFAAFAALYVMLVFFVGGLFGHWIGGERVRMLRDKVPRRDHRSGRFVRKAR